MRTVSILIPERNYDQGGLVVRRAWWIPPAFEAFLWVREAQQGAQ